MAKRRVLIESRRLFEVYVEADSADDAKKLAMETDWESAPLLGAENFVYDVLEEERREE